MSDVIVAKRIAVKWDPPTLLLEYTKNGKIRRRKMPVRNVDGNSSPSAVFEQLQKRHPQHLSARVVSTKQVSNLLQRMIDRLKSKQMKSGMSPAKNSSLSKQEDNSLLSADLNSVSEDVLRKAKSQMNAAFENNRLKPGDPGYVYDKRVDFSSKETSEWDDDMEDPEEDSDIDFNDLII